MTAKYEVMWPKLTNHRPQHGYKYQGLNFESSVATLHLTWSLLSDMDPNDPVHWKCKDCRKSGLLRHRETSPTPPRVAELGSHTKEVEDLAVEIHSLTKRLQYFFHMSASCTPTAERAVQAASAVLADLSAGQLITPSQLPLGKSLHLFYVLSCMIFSYSKCITLSYHVSNL